MSNALSFKWQLFPVLSVILYFTFFFFFKVFIYLLLAVLGLHCCAWTILQSQRAEGHCLVALLRPPVLVVSLAERGLSGAHASVVAAPELQSAGSVAAVHGFSGSAACGSFPGLGSNLCLPLWQADSLPLSHQGSPAHFFVLTQCISDRELPTQYRLVEKGPRVFSELESQGLESFCCFAGCHSPGRSKDADPL